MPMQYHNMDDICYKLVPQIDFVIGSMLRHYIRLCTPIGVVKEMCTMNLMMAPPSTLDIFTGNGWTDFQAVFSIVRIWQGTIGNTGMFRIITWIDFLSAGSVWGLWGLEVDDFTPSHNVFRFSKYARLKFAFLCCFCVASVLLCSV